VATHQEHIIHGNSIVMMFSFITKRKQKNNRPIYGSGLLGFMGDEAVDSLPSASDHTSSLPTPRSGGPKFFIVVAPSRRCELDCVLFCRARDLSVGFDLGFLPLLRAGPCERWALPRCFGRVLNKRTNDTESAQNGRIKKLSLAGPWPRIEPRSTQPFQLLVPTELQFL
jgi:hypothetical protein